VTEPRPRPQYGEYATPEAQAEAMRRRGAERRSPVSSPATPAPAVSSPAIASQPRPASRAGRVNLVVTVALLALGLLNVTVSAGSYADLPTTMRTLFAELGYGTFTPTPLVSAIGIAAVILGFVVWAAAAAVSVLLLRRGRMSWWVPLAGAAVLFVTVAVLMCVALFSDPSFIGYLEQAG
jgi:phosphoglycerol transferase MdoB-like AlkP superfamily enzyme